MILIQFNSNKIMHDFSQFLIAFGGTCGIAAWFLLKKTFSKLAQYLQTSHSQTWQYLGRPTVNSPPLSTVTNNKIRHYILNKEYDSSSDMFVKNMGSLIRQRLLFSLFCLACLIAGIILMIITTSIK